MAREDAEHLAKEEKIDKQRKKQSDWQGRRQSVSPRRNLIDYLKRKQINSQGGGRAIG